jgi:hypothetical protein
MPVILAVEITGLMCKGGIGTYLRGRGGSRFKIAGFCFWVFKRENFSFFAGIMSGFFLSSLLISKECIAPYADFCTVLFPVSDPGQDPNPDPGL